MTEEKLSLLDRLNGWASRSVMLKFFVIGILILILLIPTTMVQSLIYERQGLRDDAEKEISGKWGGEQSIGGLVLSVPYDVPTVNSKGVTVITTKYAHFLPDEMNISGSLSPEKRYRGIYMVMLYNAKLQVSGFFSPLNLEPLNIDEQSLKFHDAFVSFGVSDMRGINEDIRLRFNDSSVNFEPGIPVNDILNSGVSVPVKIDHRGKYNFSFSLDLNGSKNISFYPFGKQSRVSLKSTWPNPSFDGSFLPDKRTIGPDGFEAEWKVLQLNRNYPQQGLGKYIAHIGTDENEYIDESRYSTFGVKLMLPIDEYQKNNRSAKYSVMFIFLTFLTLFFSEILNRKRIHPIQYLLVGFGIVLFYLLLLSFSEHISFDKAYWTACSAIVALISFYVWSMFRNMKTTVVITAVFIILYGFFYSLLRLEDYALLFGSIGLLLILATVMYLTRSLNWSLVNKDEPKDKTD